MKIAQVCHKFPPSIGGIENYVNRLSRDLSAEGHAVTVLTTSTQATPALESIVIRQIPSILPNGRNPIPIGTRRILQSAHLDLVHFHSPWYFISILPLLRHLEVPVIMTVHGVYPEADSSSRTVVLGLLRPLAERAIQNCDMLIALGQREARRLERVFHVPREQVRIIPNGVDLHVCNRGDFQEANRLSARREETILFLGRATKDSRLPVLLEAYFRILADFPGSQLVLAGPGTDLFGDALSRNADAKGGQVVVFGVVSREDVCRLYNSCGIFVSLGSWEGLPTRVLEAMMHRCVPIVANSGSLAEVIVDNTNGILVRDPNPEQVSAALASLLEDSQKQHQMGKVAQQAVFTNYDWKSSFAELNALYEELAGKVRVRHPAIESNSV